MFLCKINTSEVCYLLKRKYFGDAPFNPYPIFKHWFKISDGSFNVIHSPILNRIIHFSFIWKMYKEMLHSIEKSMRKICLHLA
jgi:hypothetical protein